jgi:hypothetical protein
MDSRLQPLSLTAALNRRLYLNCLSGTGAPAILSQHESYHIGQLSLLRKMRTGRAMSYRPIEP